MRWLPDKLKWDVAAAMVDGRSTEDGVLLAAFRAGKIDAFVRYDGELKRLSYQGLVSEARRLEGPDDLSDVEPNFRAAYAYGKILGYPSHANPFRIFLNDANVPDNADLEVWLKENVRISRSQLDELWPPSPNNSDAITATAAPSLQRPAIGGRPSKHDWIGVSVFVVPYVVDNDYPPQQSTLVEAILAWFDSRQRPRPDKRQVERWVSDLYAERRRAGS